MTEIDAIDTMPLENTVAMAHQEAFYLSAEFWVGVAFVLVIFVIYKPAFNAIKSILNNRINNIKNDFQEAEELKLEAQSLYADYERKLLNVEAEINKIIAEENLLIEENKEQKIKDLNSKLRQKQNEVDGKLDLAYEKASKEINGLLIDKSIEIIYTLVKSKLTKTNYTKLIDKSISNIDKAHIN